MRSSSFRLFVDTLITASHNFFKGKKPQEVKDHFTHTVSFLARRVGKQNIVSAVVHID